MTDVLRLDDALRREDVSDAWIVWSGAAEGALADAYCFAGALFPAGACAWAWACAVQGCQALVVMRCVKLEVMLLIPLMDVMYLCTLTILKAVICVLGGMIWRGVTLSRFRDFTGQWACILRAGPLHPGSRDVFCKCRLVVLVSFTKEVHRRLCEFIHQVVVFRRDDAIRSWRNCLREESFGPSI